VDPNHVVYVEAHGTGTKVGDPQEANAICEVFCSNRSEPLLIGSVKSNMGHAEPASGVASICKMLVAMERGYLPPNLHFQEANPYIPGLLDGRLKVVVEKTPFHGGIVGVNSFGFGGSNTHIVLRSHPKTTLPPVITPAAFPKVLTYSGRTADSVHSLLKAMEDNKDDIYFQQLLSEQTNLPPKDCPFRGYVVINRDSAQVPLKDVQVCTSLFNLLLSPLTHYVCA
jgi:fatty acid synthase